MRILELNFCCYRLKSRNDSFINRIALWKLQNGIFLLFFFLNLYGTVESIHIRNIRFHLTTFISESVTTDFLLRIS